MIRTMIASVLLGATFAATATTTISPSASPSGKNGETSSGWIDCRVIDRLGIYVPVKINGHATLAWLYGGPTQEYEADASQLGLFNAEARDHKRQMELELGGLVVHGFTASDGDYAEGMSAMVGEPVPMILGEEIFRQFAVEIDFTHQRIAFHDPNALTRPKGSVEVPLTQTNGEWVIPVAVAGAQPALFELEFGNVSGPLNITPAYVAEHKLLEGVKTSQRLSGKFTETVLTVPHLGFAGVETPPAPIAVIPESEVPPPSIAGGVGLPLLERFDMLIDYSHNRIYATPRPDAVRSAYWKDRLGMVVWLRKGGGGFRVYFVSPGSPAAAAGFKVGDQIALINGKALKEWPQAQLLQLQSAAVGTTFHFKMDDGTERTVVSGDFF